MGPQRVLSKDDRDLNTATSRLDEIRERLLVATTETKNVSRNNAQLEAEKNTLESLIGEKDMDLKYFSETMNKELEAVITERDIALQRMREELQETNRNLTEAREVAAHRIGRSEGVRNVRGEQAQHAEAGNFDIPPPRQMVYDHGKTSYEMFIRSFLALADTCGWDDKERAFRMLNTLRGEAADYVVTQLDSMAQHSFYTLEHALEARFKERRSETSFKRKLFSHKEPMRGEALNPA